MSGRNRQPPPHSMKGPPSARDSPFGRGPFPPHLLDEMRGGGGGGGGPLPPHILDEMRRGGGPLPPHILDEIRRAEGGPLPPHILDEIRRSEGGPLPPHILDEIRRAEGGPLPPHILDEIRRAEGGPLPPHILDEMRGGGGGGPLPPHILDEMRRGGGPLPPHILDEMRRGEGGEDHPFGPPPGRGRQLPPNHPASIFEERMASQVQEIQGLLVDNQRLAATHVALKQELAAAQHEIQRASHALAGLEAEKDNRFREAYERSMRMETELHQVEAAKGELAQIRSDIQKLSAERQEMAGEVQRLTHELNRTTADVQQAPAIKQQIESMKQDLQHARACIEYEKKGYADSYESGQEMQKNLISMAREVEKLRSEIANAEKRARAAAAAGTQAAGYGGNYPNPGPNQNYGGNPYPAGYGNNPVQESADAAQQYGSGPATGSAPPAHPSWGGYEMQHAHGRR